MTERKIEEVSADNGNVLGRRSSPNSSTSQPQAVVEPLAGVAASSSWYFNQLRELRAALQSQEEAHNRIVEDLKRK